VAGADGVVSQDTGTDLDAVRALEYAGAETTDSGAMRAATAAAGATGRPVDAAPNAGKGASCAVSKTESSPLSTRRAGLCDQVIGDSPVSRVA